ncbi:run domain Beclin-1-interacting and cysteine-rich domain-containing protein [Zeugodacus cucurbitae]|uniref:run domain Beclin-1-interacting and cysteine-rich domain-containing protein n=1 Tax=Zeugodacus cucurbitae TaxID=28588 RepID=UPI0023D9554B|nr:run domain Beclin-1-interacting and cysteine-rich domain-containing protein [Zeugodacus cucurbitae]
MSTFCVKNNSVKMDLPVLLANLKKSCGLWFLNEQPTSVLLNNENTNLSSYGNITTATVEILRHGLRTKSENTILVGSIPAIGLSSENICNEDTDWLKKIVDDFEWVCRSAQIRDSLVADFTSQLPAYGSINQIESSTSAVNESEEYFIERFLRTWVLRNLQSNCLSVCLQVLVAEKELLNTYYTEEAFLRNEAYSTALFICLSAVELNQYSLLSQIDTKLYSPKSATRALTTTTATKHRRTTSHPEFSISPPKNTNILKTRERYQATKVEKEVPKNDLDKMTDLTDTSSNARAPALLTFRKTKSLPTLEHKPYVSFGLFFDEQPRPRSKTMAIKTRNCLGKENRQPFSSEFNAESTLIETPKINNSSSSCYSNSNTTNNTTTTSGSSYSDCDITNLELPTSNRQNQQQAFASAKTSQRSPNSSSSTRTTSISSLNSTPACRIELINCDDIKIWTDQAYEQTRTQQSSFNQEIPTTVPCTIPQGFAPLKQKAKSASPLGSFLCNLFSTPPTYTHWSISNQNDNSYASNLDESESNALSAVTAFPCNSKQHADNSTISSGVFDAFMPVYGKKLRSRHSQNLFEDGISTLDYKTQANETPTELTVESGAKVAEKSKPLPKCEQSLTDFLQTSQMSRNNTDLEKENAHFRVSEAIISAIEHIKWDNSMDPEKKWHRRKETSQSSSAVIATDCLTNENTSSRTHKTDTTPDEASEHIPYAELDENCLDSLSAEVVGLSLISKFNDKHLPKVSELKWLVSEEDTPQQLLPMPDNSPTSNPDENVIRPITRGTRYWAPPRQQIIFTDHPTMNRKELIQKQNNRCAGCGMRVSRQYINSFRYCTYLGKYHCTGCHRNQISPIPAKILQSWDFKSYPVSVFSYRLLDQMYTYPLFYVPDLNPALYINNKTLLSARKKRVHLKFVKDFVKTCRFAVREQVYFESIPEHIANDPDIWSLSDFIDVRNKSMQHSIDELIEKCEHHIFNCVLCTARGFHCEYCQKDQVIYPWQQNVFRCDRCGACFHLSCWKLMSNTCCRCQRISKRQEIAVT